MPGSDVVNKQTALGGAAGIALLLFALTWRFFPGMPAPQSVPALPADTAAQSRPLVVAQAQPSAASVSASTAERERAAQWGPPISLAPPPPPAPKEIAALLKKADDAFAKGRLLDAKDGALALYRQVLEADRRSAPAKAGVEKVRNAVLQQASDALDRGDEDESAHAIAALRDEALDSEHVDELQSRLKRLRQTTPLLTRAAGILHREARDDTEATKNRNEALAVYRQVTKIDPGNKLADQGLAQIERSYLDRALAAAAQDDYAGADDALRVASAIRPGSQQLLDTRSQIQGIREQRASAVMAQANSALDAGNADLAQLLAQRALGLSPDLAGVDAFNERLRNARLYASYKPGQVLNDPFVDRNGRAPALVVIPIGSFLMGSSATEAGHRSTEEPQHEVKIALGYALGRDEVSVGEFRAFVDDAKYVTDAEKLGGSTVYDEDSGRTIERRGVSWRNDYSGAVAGDDLPVVHVSWNDAVAYAQWLSARTGKRYRLPSEAEYEYALRAGTTTRYWWGDGNPPPRIANLTGDGDKSPMQRRWTNAFPRYSDGYWGPAPIGKFPPNPFGLRDIDGNVADWIEDCWHDNYLRAPANGRAWVNPGCQRHVVRGASWGSAPDQARSAFRTSLPVDARNAQVGIRVARDL
ncbi:MAG: formylglycine-generating enzyme family protein [Proteobacteria bacterium]|uniref:SUMF1/EgtB/PvdO family nonheme iron enzyme n=1 Tax=Rudaea sp. TaxID=2136325 RepID=UPI003783E160|nr:formylglycine-generating enzyme family protein [Pseudomonadota bacterium]